MENLTDRTELSEVSQKDLLKKKLLEIKKEVIKDDRVNCAAITKKSILTVERYLNGHVKDIGTAYRIFSYLKEALEKRITSLK